MVPPQMIWSADVHEATSPQSRGLGASAGRGLVESSRLRSPNVRSDGSAQASDASTAERTRGPMPASRRVASVPMSQNERPLLVVGAPPTVVVAADAG